MHTDASKCQLGSAMVQNNKLTVCFSRKLNKSQQNCTAMELELLATVEMLKECRNTLLGQDVTACADHKNLTHEVFNAKCVMRWLLMCEEFEPTLVCLKGEKNVVADVLSRLHPEPKPKSQCDESALEHPGT